MFRLRYASAYVVLVLASLPAITLGEDDHSPKSPDSIWESLTDLPERLGASKFGTQPERFHAVFLDTGAFARAKKVAPMEFTDAARQAPVILHLPMPDGSFAAFQIVNSPIMEPGLSAKFPEIQTFSGKGLDDPATTVRFDWTLRGFHAQILSPDGIVYVEPLEQDDRALYISYNTKDDRRQQPTMECMTQQIAHEKLEPLALASASGETLLTYRLACAASGEYTAFYGGTVALGMSAITTLFNQINGILENQMAIRMVLVANNNLIVYTNGATDPYNNTNELQTLDENQANVDFVIGNANYDVGIVLTNLGAPGFTTGWACVSCVCGSGIKARTMTGSPTPTNIHFNLVVAHELGHQFGAFHTFNTLTGGCGNPGQYGPNSAYEPGSGSTIMSYASICGADNVQNFRDGYFHTFSYDEIRAYVTAGWGSTCGVSSSTGNTAPTVDAGANYTIPASTPFELTAVGSDSDGDALTYLWEERDLGPPQTLAAPDNGSSPLLRSWPATSNPTRIFPRLSNLLNNTLPLGEKLPTTNRTMNFRVMALDNRAGGGGATADDMTVTVVNSAGPFLVTSPNTFVMWDGVQTVTWNVANTDAAPVSCASVDILLSNDSGNTFPTVLASSTPNDGSESITLPDIDSITARIKVKGSNNVFFDISNSNFQIGNCPVAAAPASENPAFAKERTLSMVPGNAGVSAAIRVKLTNLPPGFDFAEGDTMWVGPPRAISESSSSSFGSPPPTFQGANLQCSPLCRDWSSVGLLHVFDFNIMPGAQYTLQMVNCGCGFGNENSFSLPLLFTTPRHGDVVGSYVGTGWTNPNGTIDFQDIGAIVDKFKGLPTAPTKVRVDIGPDAPDAIIDFVDIGDDVDAFRGLGYLLAAPQGCP